MHMRKTSLHKRLGFFFIFCFNLVLTPKCKTSQMDSSYSSNIYTHYYKYVTVHITNLAVFIIYTCGFFHVFFVCLLLTVTKGTQIKIKNGGKGAVGEFFKKICGGGFSRVPMLRHLHGHCVLGQTVQRRLLLLMVLPRSHVHALGAGHFGHLQVGGCGQL